MRKHTLSAFMLLASLSVCGLAACDKGGEDSPAEAVDLGLPSGTKWADRNVGASLPEEYGGYFAWGETEEKDTYTKDNCLTFGKDIGDDIAGTDYDVAHVKWGGDWVMPTLDQMDELCTSCTWTWTELNGVSGYLVTGSNGNSIFMPACGYRYEAEHRKAGSYGYYWSSTTRDTPHESGRARSFNESRLFKNVTVRYWAFCVRPVSSR